MGLLVIVLIFIMVIIRFEFALVRALLVIRTTPHFLAVLGITLVLPHLLGALGIVVLGNLLIAGVLVCVVVVVISVITILLGNVGFDVFGFLGHSGPVDWLLVILTMRIVMIVITVRLVMIVVSIGLASELHILVIRALVGLLNVLDFLAWVVGMLFHSSALIATGVLFQHAFGNLEKSQGAFCFVFIVLVILVVIVAVFIVTTRILIINWFLFIVFVISIRRWTGSFRGILCGFLNWSKSDSRNNNCLVLLICRGQGIDQLQEANQSN
mmetsp:Transcript_14833/g.25729  ORF Transcript_14833/g.25729 Transcript_14833/m.25729 type:complete len:269 (+) Transcript_14833:132-938(+)